MTEGKIDRPTTDYGCLGRRAIFQMEICQSPKQSQPLSCPQCGCNSLFRAGLYYLSSGSQLQRWLCTECNHRFTERTVDKKLLRVLEKALKTSNLDDVECQDSYEFRRGRARYLLAEGINLDNRGPEQINAQREGTTQTQRTIPPFISKDVNSKIENYLWELKQNGLKENTIKNRSRLLYAIAKHANLTQPDTVKEYLAKNTQIQDSTKNTTVVVYDSFLKYHCIMWKPPKYKAVDKPYFIPTEQELDALIASSSKMLSVFLKFLKETGARSGEIAFIRWKDVDFERKIVHITPEKGSKARILPISNQLIDMLNRLHKKEEKIFPSFVYLKQAFHKTRKTLIYKLQNPRLKDIRLHTFRHWKATMEYHKDKDIGRVQQLLGHRSIQSTMIYISLENSLFQNTYDEYTIRQATTIEEATKLLEVGFEYVTEMDGAKLFRKRK